MIIISACLCGVNCKYNGDNNLNKKALELLRRGKAIVVCPEQLGGLETPRVPHEIQRINKDNTLKVVSKNGINSTEKFLKGAEEALKIANSVGAKVAILKSKSPSCGFGEIYDGTFSGKKVKDNGITANLFKENGIKIFTEKDLDSIDLGKVDI